MLVPRHLICRKERESVFSFIFSLRCRYGGRSIARERTGSLSIYVRHSTRRQSAVRKQLKQPRGEERCGNRFSCRAKGVLCPAGKSFPLVHILARNLIRRQFTVAVVTIGFEVAVASRLGECTREYVHTLYAPRFILNWEARGRRRESCREKISGRAAECEKNCKLVGSSYVPSVIVLALLITRDYHGDIHDPIFTK